MGQLTTGVIDLRTVVSLSCRANCRYRDGETDDCTLKIIRLNRHGKCLMLQPGKEIAIWSQLELSCRAAGALQQYGIRTVEELRDMGPHLRMVPGIGQRSLQEIQKALEDYDAAAQEAE